MITLHRWRRTRTGGVIDCARLGWLVEMLLCDEPQPIPVGATFTIKTHVGRCMSGGIEVTR